MELCQHFALPVLLRIRLNLSKREVVDRVRLFIDRVNDLVPKIFREPETDLHAFVGFFREHLRFEGLVLRIG